MGVSQPQANTACVQTTCWQIQRHAQLGVEQVFQLCSKLSAPCKLVVTMAPMLTRCSLSASRALVACTWLGVTVNNDGACGRCNVCWLAWLEQHRAILAPPNLHVACSSRIPAEPQTFEVRTPALHAQQGPTPSCKPLPHSHSHACICRNLITSQTA